MRDTGIQNLYAEEFANCFGCGRNNQHGLQLKSYWRGDECICHHTPKSHYIGGVPGFPYGGIIASFIGCHGVPLLPQNREKAESRPRGLSPLPLMSISSNQDHSGSNLTSAEKPPKYKIARSQSLFSFSPVRPFVRAVE